MSEPLNEIPYGRQTIEDDDVEAVVAALRSPFLTSGPRVENFEAALCAATGARHAVAVATGTAALHAACFAAGVGPGDEVLTSPISFAASANAAAFLGAKPTFADVDPELHLLDIGDVKRRLTARTKAIIAVDYAGHPADYAALAPLADATGALLIADACHSLGATVAGRRVGTLAAMTCLSFHPVKAITTGEGGAVLTDDDSLARACRRFRSHGIVRGAELTRTPDGPWYHEMVDLGYNYRITDMQCALGTSQVAKLARFIARRRALAARYDALLAGLAGLKLPSSRPGVEPAWHLYAVEVEAARRGAIYAYLKQRGIGVQVHYIPIYRHPYYRRLLGEIAADYPHAEAFYAAELSLPLFPTLSESDQDRVVAVLTAALAEA